MMNPRFNFTLLLFCCLFSTAALAQVGKKPQKEKKTLSLIDENDDEDDPNHEIDSLELALSQSSKLSFNAGYANKVIVQGRNYGLDSYSLIPGLKYEDKSGFSVYLNFNAWDTLPETPGRGLRNAETDLGLSYTFNLMTSLDVSLTYEHWFVQYGPDTLRQALTNYFNADLSYDLNFASVGMSAYYITGRQTGYGLDFNVAAPFEFSRLFGKDKLKIIPSAMANFASGNVQRPYLLQVYNKKTGQPLIDRFGKPVYTRKTSTDNKFKALNYEIILPVTYSLLGIVDITPALHYAIPVNVETGENIVDGKYSSSPFFYFSLDTSWLLWRKKKP